MSAPQSGIQRQHELDALRAFAMVLGIALHGALSFAPGFPWPVQDLHLDSAFIWIFWGIHGFRMPLFILISGYFTMMLWRRKGLGALLKQRTYRVLFPLLLGLVTILPSLIAAIILAVTLGFFENKQILIESAKETEVIECIRAKNYDGLKQRLEAGDNPDQVDGKFAIRALCWAAMFGDIKATTLLVEHGAKVMAQDAEGDRPLNRAAYFGQLEIVELLLQKGADPSLPGSFFQSPADSTRTDRDTAEKLAKTFDVELLPEDALKKGREECRIRLGQAQKAAAERKKEAEGTPTGLESIRQQYKAYLDSDSFAIPLGPNLPPFHLIKFEFMIHLWFLWTLCWLVALFAIFVPVLSMLPLPKIAPALVVSPLRWIWILPLTMLPQLFMSIDLPLIGPDTSAGVLPRPHVLFYYAIFFFFGALYYDCDDKEGRLCQWWWIELPIALMLVLPMAVFMLDRSQMPAALASIIPPQGDLIDHVLISGGLQVVYVWLMSSGMIGLFRTFMSHETKTIRYFSDASYWFYLAHLTPMFVIQALVRTWPISPWIKFGIVCGGTCLILLVTYQYLVRYTWIGRLLNGPRVRPGMVSEPRVNTSQPLPTPQNQGVRAEP